MMVSALWSAYFTRNASCDLIASLLSSVTPVSSPFRSGSAGSISRSASVPGILLALGLSSMCASAQINVIRGNPTVCSHPQDPILLGRCCRCRDLADILTGIGVDLFPERFLCPGAFRHESVSGRCLLQQALRLPSGLFLRLRAYVFQCMAHSHSSQIPLVIRPAVV